MSDYSKLSPLIRPRKCPSASHGMTSEAISDCPSMSTSSRSSFSSSLSSLSSCTSLESLSNEKEPVQSGAGRDAWLHLEKTSTPKEEILRQARIRAFVVKAVTSLNFSLEIAEDVQKVREVVDICYGGRDLLDLASNIVPYSWQRKTPLLQSNSIYGTTLRRSEQDGEAHEKYPMKRCLSCGFSQPVLPA